MNYPANLGPALIVSVAMLILGATFVTIWLAQHDQIEPPKTAPLYLRITWPIAYVLLIVAVIIGQWSDLGEPFNYASWTAVTALVVNVVALAFSLYYAREKRRDRRRGDRRRGERRSGVDRRNNAQAQNL